MKPQPQKLKWALGITLGALPALIEVEEGPQQARVLEVCPL